MKTTWLIVLSALVCGLLAAGGEILRQLSGIESPAANPADFLIGFAVGLGIK